jgi:hypothetical protein
MIDYVLFDEQPFQLFIDWLKKNDIAHQVRIVEDSYEISVSEDLDEDLLDAIDEQYDIYMDMNQQLVEQQERDNNDGYHMAGVVLTLKDGSTSYADVDPQLLGRVMSAISPEEFGEIVNAIVDAVENPQPKTYCQRQRDDQVGG